MRLKKARLEAGMTLQEIADQLQVADTTLGRFEKGTVRIRRPYIKEMIDFYGISSRREREALIQLNEDAWRKDWWEGDTSDLDTEFLDYTWLESRVGTIREFEAMLIPGLLQTKDYATAVMEHGPEDEARPERLDRMVDLRLARQCIFDRTKPAELSVVLDESVLRRQVGGQQILWGQLSHLIEASECRHIDIRVLRLESGWHPGVAGSFTLFEMPDPYPDVAYVENLVGRTFLENEHKVSQFREAYDCMHQTALGSQDSMSFIRTVMKEFE